MKTFTRGGQVTLHNIKMIKQVVLFTAAFSLFLGAATFSAKIYLDFSAYECRAAWAYCWGCFKFEIPFVSKRTQAQMTQYYTFEDNTKDIVKTIDIVNDSWHRELVARMGDQLIYNGILSAWASLGFFLLVCSGWVWRGKKTKEKRILSGSEVVEPKGLQRLLEKQKIASSFKIGGVSLKLDSETQHLIFTGTTGTGKSNCFMELMPQIRKRGQRAVVVDTTGEFVSRFYREGKDVLINPFDSRSDGWNPWLECQFPYHYDELVTGFIPQTGYDSFWPDAARMVFSEALIHLNKNGARSIEKLLELLLNSSLKDLHHTLRHTAAASLLDPTGDKTAMSIRSHLTPYLKVLKYLPKDKLGFSVRDWVLQDRGDSWLFIVATPDQRETLKPLITGLMTVALNGLMSAAPDPKRRLWFIIDELVSLQKQESLPKALAEIRKYGGCIAAGVQDFAQLQELYGHAEMKSISSLFNTKVIFRNNDPQTAQYMSQMLGEQQVIETAEGISYGENSYRDGVSLNEQKRERPLVSATDIMALKDLEAYLKMPGDFPVTRLKFDINKIDKVCASFVPVFDPVSLV